jgi:hypothetical protein
LTFNTQGEHANHYTTEVIYNSNTVIYVTPFLIGQHKIFAGINYMIDVTKQLSL